MAIKQKKSNQILDLFHDKKIKPWFWVFTVIYLLVAGYLILSANPWNAGHADGLFIGGVLLVPYYVLFTVYIIFVHRNDKEK